MPELLILCPAIIFIAGLFAPQLKRMVGERVGYLLSLAPFTALALLLSQSACVASGEGLFYSFEWFSALGASIDLRLDGLSFMMASLVTGIGGFIVIYTQGYMHGHPQLGRFYLYLLAFMASMVGLVLADNLILLFIFWELTSITSYLLIGFNHESKEARWKALQALLVTGLGAMAMLAGFILLAQVTGSWKISEVNQLGELVRGSPLYPAIMVLVLIGAFTKSAQLPFHFWLPNAMAGPTPVSAFLHSATMVKAGIFLMALLTPVLGGTALWGTTLSIFGAATLLLAMFLGLFQKDIKAVLAYTTLGVLGVLTMLLGIGSKYAIKAMVVFLIGHALYKATLFMVVGSIDHETGTRDVTLLRGLRKVMPITATAGALAAFSMSGLPPFFGFIGKELIYKAGVQLDGLAIGFLVAAFVGNLVMMGLALKAGVGPFIGKSNVDALPKKPHEAPFSMWIGPIILASAGLMLGIVPFWVTEFMVAPAVASIRGTEMISLKLQLWDLVKPNLPLLLSGMTVLSGFFVFLYRARFWVVADAVLLRVRPFGAEAMYERIFHGIVRFSKWQTAKLQTGLLHDYVFFIVGSTTLLVGWVLLRSMDGFPAMQAVEFDFWVAGLVVLMAVAAVCAAISKRYFIILGALGMIGFGIALLFAYYGAPDLAITQLMVEALTVVLFMFVISGLPPIRGFSLPWTKGRDAILAGSFGLIVALLAWLAVDLHFAPSIASTLAEMSYPEAKGKNVVNVILVDFRALDTFGETTVVAAAALGIAALMSSRRIVKSKSGRKMP